MEVHYRLQKRQGRKQIPGLFVHFHVRYSQPNGKVRCSIGWDFRKRVVNRDQSKVKEISFKKLNL